MRTRLLALLAALLVCVVAGPLQAANLILNGDFETVVSTSDGTTPYTHSTIINGDNPSAALKDWTTTGYNFVMQDNPGYINPFNPGPHPGDTLTGADDAFDGAYTTTDGGSFVLYGPDSYVDNGLTNSPAGGNFLVADGAYLNRTVEQTLTGLEVGKTYALSFYWAAAQQGGFNGPTSEGWIVCIGTCEYHFAGTPEGSSYFDADPTDGLGFYDNTDTSQLFKTDVRNNADHGFVPWQYENYTFTAQSDSQTISLLAYGTPIGQPPFALLDGLSIEAVPEPTTWAMMLIGFGVIGGVMRTRRQPLTGRRALNAQII